MEDRKKRNATNDNINLQSDILTDLPVTDEQAEETRGGSDGHVHADYLVWRKNLGSNL